MLPVIGRCLLESLTFLASTRAAAGRPLRRRDHRRRGALPATWPQGSPAIVTPLNRYIGYEAAAAVAKESIARAPGDPRGRALARPRRSPASSPRPSSTRRWTCWPWPARPAEEPARRRTGPGTTATRTPLGVCGSLVSPSAAGRGADQYQFDGLGVAPRGARRAVDVLDVLQAPLDLGGRVGLPVGAGAGHLGAGQRLRDAVGAGGAVAGVRVPAALLHPQRVQAAELAGAPAVVAEHDAGGAARVGGDPGGDGGTLLRPGGAGVGRAALLGLAGRLGGLGGAGSLGGGSGLAGLRDLGGLGGSGGLAGLLGPGDGGQAGLLGDARRRAGRRRSWPWPGRRRPGPRRCPARRPAWRPRS